MDTKKKEGLFKKIGNWWVNLTNDQQWMVVCGVYLVDGLVIGSAVSKMKFEKKQAKKIEALGASKGYILGQIDAYKEMAREVQNPKISNQMMKKH